MIGRKRRTRWISLRLVKRTIKRVINRLWPFFSKNAFQAYFTMTAVINGGCETSRRTDEAEWYLYIFRFKKWSCTIYTNECFCLIFYPITRWKNIWTALKLPKKAGIKSDAYQISPKAKGKTNIYIPVYLQ